MRERLVLALRGAIDRRSASGPTSVGGSPNSERPLLGLVPALQSLAARIDRRRIAALVGVAPVNRDSGTMRGRRAIAGGRTDVRNVLYMAALVASRCDATIRELYLSLRCRGRPAKAALVAAMHKLLSILNAILRDQRPWQYP
jgi:transposase